MHSTQANKGKYIERWYDYVSVCVSIIPPKIRHFVLLQKQVQCWFTVKPVKNKERRSLKVILRVRLARLITHWQRHGLKPVATKLMLSWLHIL